MTRWVLQAVASARINSARVVRKPRTSCDVIYTSGFACYLSRGLFETCSKPSFCQSRGMYKWKCTVHTMSLCLTCMWAAAHIEENLLVFYFRLLLMKVLTKYVCMVVLQTSLNLYTRAWRRVCRKYLCKHLIKKVNQPASWAVGQSIGQSVGLRKHCGASGWVLHDNLVNVKMPPKRILSVCPSSSEQKGERESYR